MVDFYNSVSTCFFDFIGLTETWLKSDVSNSELFPDSYLVMRADRNLLACDASTGGGALLAVKHDLKPTPIDLSFFHEQFSLIDIVGCKICIDYYFITVIVIYISTSVALEYYDQFLEALAIYESFLNRNIIIMGDFNAPLFGTDQVANDSKSAAIARLMEMMNMGQFNKIPNANGRYLDLIFSNVSCIVSLDDNEISIIDKHHPPLRCEVECTLNSSKQFKKCINSQKSFNFRKANFPLLYESMYNADFSEMYSSSSVDEACDTFYKILNNIFLVAVPYKKETSRRYPHWYTSEIINLIKRKELAYRNYTKYQTNYNHSVFKNIRSTLKSKVKAAFQAYTINIENNIHSDSSLFWSYVQSKKGRSRIPGIIRDDNTEFSSPSAIVEAFSNFFQSVYATPGDANINIDPNSITKCYVNIKLIEEPDVVEAAKKLKNKLTSGTDSIPSFVVKDCINILSKPLTFLFNISIKSGVFPECWKTARVTPVFKKDDPCELHNYRPISLLCNFSKLLERCIFNQVYSQVQGFISVDQHGFMKKRSCDTNLCCISQYISSALDGQGQVDVAYVDFRKAFDQIDHDIFLYKLEHMGFSTPLVSLTKSYLVGRRQFVEVDGSRSEEYIVKSGVPQGSILGPLFFAIFLDSLTKSLTCEKLFFADDLKIYNTIDSLEDCLRLQTQMTLIENWCTANKLYLNCSKCFIVTYCRKKTCIDFDYRIGNSILTKCTEIKDLGVTFDQYFDFKAHINMTVSSASRSIGFILRNCKGFQNLDTIKLLFYSFVRSKLEFGSIVWHPIYQIDILKLESVQRRLLKYLAFRSDGVYPVRGFNHNLLLERFQFSSLLSRRHQLAITFLYKLLNNKIDCMALSNEVQYIVPRLNARNSLTFFCSRPRSNMLYRAPIYYLCNLFNTYCNNCDIFRDPLSLILKAIP